MKTYLKVFILAFVCFTLLIGSGIFAFVKYYPAKPTIEEIQSQKTVVVNIDDKDDGGIKVKEKTELEKLIESTNRINILCFGTDGARADTIMFVSYDPDNKLVDILSIPRDTYNSVKGHNLAGQHKINAVYGFGGADGGSKGLLKQVSLLLDLPIDYYVKVNYNGVRDIVDILGGVEINVRQDMDYDDPYVNPPLHIHIKKGRQVLNGQKAMEYLRWRKNNGESGAGDLPRTKRQQEFVIEAAKKAMSLKLPKVAKTAFSYVTTDMSLDKVVYYATTAVDLDFSNIKTYRLPGDVKYEGTSYYIHDPEATEKMMIEILSRGTNTN
ncbi:MAG: LCP family protein [Firmicutes bacterium]|jgi:LCP family protein required for cell wall assembly|nr:LCP family protein [Bacillota bacterium]